VSECSSLATGMPESVVVGGVVVIQVLLSTMG
jgi:hypothetical protein